MGWGSWARRALAVLLLATGHMARGLPEAPLTLPDARVSSPLGTNLTLLKDWSPEWAFVDAFKQSRAWVSGGEREWNDRRPLDLDPAGWVQSLQPGQVARAMLFWHPGLVYPSGDYTVLYDGEGTLAYSSNAQVVGASKGRQVVRVDARQGGLLINLTATNPRDHLRNIRVLMPGGACSSDAWCDRLDGCAPSARCRFFEQSYSQERFHPTFIASLAGYSTLRFMDWMATDEAEVTQAKWADRPTLEDVRWTEKGVPLEVIIDLANLTGADPWFNVHHLADDDYVRQMATLIKTRLDPKLRIYVEHSNEVWNQEYAQARYAEKRGLETKLSPNKFEAQLRWHAQRSVQIFKIFEQVLGGRQRLVRVMGAQSGNAWGSETMLGFQDAAKSTDALAIAPYFGGYLGTPAEVARVEKMSVEALLAELEQKAVPQAIEAVEKQAAVAKRFGVQLIAYEGGQHLVGVGALNKNERLSALFDAVNRDPRIKPIYTRYLQAWKEKGGRLFVHYQNTNGYSLWGRFGARESLEQPRKLAPKYDALMEFAEKSPRWWK